MTTRKSYQQRKADAVIMNNEPTLTDQGGARDTDINIIVRSMGVGNTLPGNTKQPITGDFTSIPEDLRGMIEESRAIENYRSTLPAQLREMPMEQLLALTQDDLVKIMQPPAQPPVDQPKEGNK